MPSLLKTYRYRSKKHLAFIATQPCMICSHPAEPHHLLRAGGKGMGIKASDSHAVPLCHFCHMELHSDGNEIKWFEYRGWEYEKVKNHAKKLFEQSIVAGRI
jgi:hypothetical protein